jgi:hypothetical protein
MLRVVAPYVAEMLHLKSLIINRVAGVAGFQTMSTCKPHLNSLAINVLVSFFNGFLCLSSGHTLNFGTVPHLSRLKKLSPSHRLAHPTRWSRPMRKD